MDNELFEQAKKLAARNYTLSVFEDILSNGTKIYMAKNPELKGCMAQGVSFEEAIKNLEEARLDYIYDSLEDGVPVPFPAALAVCTSSTIFSGQAIITDDFTFEDIQGGVAQPCYRKPLYEAWIST